MPRQSLARRVAVPLAGLALLAALVVLSLATGSRPLTTAEVLAALHHRDTSVASVIVWELRMPRTLLAVLVGAALAVAGVTMQGLTRNPLAEPGLLGVNAGAALAVVLSIAALHLHRPVHHLAFALVGALAGSAFVAVVGTSRGPRTDPARLVLAGAALTACLGACTGIVTLLDSSAFSSYHAWVVGTVADRDPSAHLLLLPVLLGGTGLAAAVAPALNALALGADHARGLGVRPARTTALAVTSVALLCGGATAVAGPIGFVGLVVPHVLRLLVGVDQRRLLTLSLVAGPCLVLLADVLGRLLVRPDELEAGIVTAFLGAPVLLVLLRRVLR